MKTYLLILVVTGLSTLVGFAQTDDKLRKDGTYSVHNYKHPNKAAIARQWSTQKGITVQAPQTVSNQIPNYKQQVPSAVTTGGIVVPHTEQVDITERNYKIQRVSSPRSTVSEQPK